MKMTTADRKEVLDIKCQGTHDIGEASLEHITWVKNNLCNPELGCLLQRVKWDKTSVCFTRCRKQG